MTLKPEPITLFAKMKSDYCKLVVYAKETVSRDLQQQGIDLAKALRHSLDGFVWKALVKEATRDD